ncbi:hypothetical protein ACFXTH_002890 [Malus domestica]
MDRGPRYRAYTELRESWLRRKYMSLEESKEPESKLTLLKKQVKFQTHLIDSRKGSSVLAQSMPDFSTVLLKKNHKPSSRLPSMQEITPPAKSWVKEADGVLSNSRGSKSAIEQNPTMYDSFIDDSAFSNASKIFRSSRFKMSRVQEEL